MLIIAQAVVRKTTLVDVYLSAGPGGHVITFLFFAVLVLARVIHCKGLGLRHRLVFMLIAFLPFLAGIYFATAGFVRQAQAVRRGSPIAELVSPWSLIGAIPVGAFESVCLLGVSSLLLLSKRTEPGGPAVAQVPGSP